MSKKQFKSHASSSRVGFGAAPSAFGSASVLSYLAEPPELSSLSDPNLVVSFKNLSKKDSTTKSKALEEIQTWVSARNDLEEAFISAWEVVYPRVTIDNARRVRQLAHSVQGQISSLAGKRIAKYLPGVVGSWLAGLHDADKMVARTAQDALGQTFPSADKRASLKKTFQAQILSYCKDAIVEETPQTLSDERTTTPEDAEAKHARVIVGAASTLLDLLASLSQQDVDKERDTYEEILQSPVLWSLLSLKDPQARIALLALLRFCINNHIEFISSQTDALGKNLLSKTTVRHQTGSALAFSEAVLAFCSSFPEVWHSVAKTGALDLFRNLIKYGSQSGPPQYWTNISRIAATIPEADLPSTLDESKKIMEGLMNGITIKNEPRANSPTAWICYFAVLRLTSRQLTSDEKTLLYTDLMVPIISQYLSSQPDMPRLPSMGNEFANILANAVSSSKSWPSFIESWTGFSAHLQEAIRISAPEQSKDFKQSQNAVSLQSHRWFELQGQLFAQTPPSDFITVMSGTSQSILETAIEVLRTRHGKPYGAAACLESALKSSKSLVLEQKPLKAALESFLAADLPVLIGSPSSTQLIHILYALNESQPFPDAWKASVHSLLGPPSSPDKLKILDTLLSQSNLPADFDLVFEDKELQNAILQHSFSGTLDIQSTELASRSLSPSSNVLAPWAAQELLSRLTTNLSLDSTVSDALDGLKQMMDTNSRHVKPFLDQDGGAGLVQGLLKLEESENDEWAQAASQLSSKLERISKLTQGPTASKSSMLQVIQRELAEASDRSLSIETIFDLATRLLSDTSAGVSLESLCPALNIWESALQPYVDLKLPRSYAIHSPLGGIMYLSTGNLAIAEEQSTTSRDGDGFSIPIRIALYTTKLLKSAKGAPDLPHALRVGLYKLISISSQIVQAELDIAGSNRAWLPHDTITDDIMLDFLSDSQHLLDGLPREEAQRIHGILFDSAADLSPSSFISALAYGRNVAQTIELSGWNSSSTQTHDDTLRSLRQGKMYFQLAAYLYAYQSPLGSSPYLSRTCNELVANLTGADPSQNEAVLRDITLLNLILRLQEDLLDSIATQRLVFLVKHLAEALSQPFSSQRQSVKSETLTILTFALPAIANIYGDMWETIIIALERELRPQDSQQRSDSIDLPSLHASLKLLSVMQNLVRDEETNDDVKEAWSEATKRLSDGLLAWLKLLSSVHDEHNQPLRFINSLLSRHIKALAPGMINNMTELYPLIHARSAIIQQAAFDLLHKQVPKQQEEISLNAALEKSTQKVPDELLSIVTGVPPLDSLVDVDQRAMPMALKAYLSGWLLVFDHFKNASDKVKSDYAAQIKENACLDDLLAFIFGILGHSKGRPVDASKFSISTYSFDIEESPMKDFQWLLIHLYYLSLKRLPSLCKTWWLDCKSRQTRTSVESWTEKYISPYIISDILTGVEEWASTQDADADEALIIKTNPRANEIVASKEIDEQQLSIVISMPANFPLSQAQVEGRNRVAVDEKRWRAWILNCQGVIQFSNNSITDGLIAFRRNVMGALKGQTECAICYSLVSADKQLPTKKCGTCKNAFHGSCLYRWFKSSNSSSCPLCRNSFNYS